MSNGSGSPSRSATNPTIPTSLREPTRQRWRDLVTARRDHLRTWNSWQEDSEEEHQEAASLVAGRGK
nr:hypothetical protein [Streptomyces antimycoticus]